HFLPTGSDSTLNQDPLDIDAFLAERERLLLPAIATVTGAEITEDRVHEAYLHPDQPFTNDLALRRLLRQLSGEVFWYEQHMDRKALEVLIDELDRDNVTGLRLLSGPANLREKTKRAFDRFERELQAGGVPCEWRVLPADRAREIHARALFDAEGGYELPPLGSILKGTVDSIRKSDIPRGTFEEAWRGAEADRLQDFQVPAG
ncbi:MAG: hypothetical protein M3355_08615, partial [Actinomycetota bacterium]|nr:hypothetical protein [Actinomycetota bacterium]